MRKLASVIVLFMASTAHAEMKDYIYLLKPARPEMVTAGPNEREKAVLGEHGAYLTRLTQDGTLYLAGRTQEADSMGIAIFRASSDEEAKKIMNSDPAVAKGIMTATLHPYGVAFLTGRATAEDKRAIDELHRRDVEASKKSDFATLRSLLSDDMVMIAPGQTPKRGREAEMPASKVKVLDYQLKFDEVKVLGDYAFEWGTISGATQMPDGSISREQYNVMRILKRDREGNWKVHRSIWNERK